MSDTWIVDLRHYLNEYGAIAISSGPGLRLAEYFTAITQETTGDPYGEQLYPKVPCRRRPNRKPCVGEIASYIDPDDQQIVWICPVCGDNGTISGWQGTLWDLTQADTTAH
ncbi:hypothetical protein QWY20_16390 [Alkalimonas sp. MEB108]|uniref:Uncharacterized protein n=1 Tax=Alkalimonas cellulosilytica TaxID=3058395 RepID=A0ABU7J933_9GAMM|nr:hypothetical protein [Alkalimonas sp. MEB108]MEE2003039.1 hypothetical protein [Alkalimonas sp. MEB108]